MNCHETIARLSFVFCAMLWGLLSGCSSTIVYQQPLFSVQLPEGHSKIDLPVELLITDKFKEAKSERHVMGDTLILPIGENLALNAKRLASNVFTQAVIRDMDEKPHVPRSRYILEPQFAFAKQSVGVYRTSEARILIGIEWKVLNDRSELVWIETVQGEGIGENGSVLTYRDKMTERVQRALQDLFKKSQAAILDSQVLRKLR